MASDTARSAWLRVWAGLLVVAAGHAVAAAAAAQPARVALVIGNGAYGTLPAAPACPAAARAVADKLRAVGFDVVSRNDVTIGGFDAVVGDFSNRLGRSRGATGFIYVCSRGASLNDRAFLLPVSATLGRPTDVFTQGILAKSLYDTLKRSGAGSAVVALDVIPPATDARPAGFAPIAQGSGLDGLAALTVIEAGGNTESTPLAQALVSILARPTLQTGELVTDAQEKLRTVSSTSIAVAHQPKTSGYIVGEPPAPPPAAAPPPVQAAPPAATPPATASPPAAATPPTAAAPPAAATPPTPVATMPEEHLMTMDDRRRVQEALHDLGYYNFQVDGVFGPETRAAIRRYQMQLMQEPTGRLTPQQAGLLVSGRK